VIRVDYLVRVISLLLLIGILTSCVPEEDAVESSSSGGGANLGGAQILWGNYDNYDNNTAIIFSNPFTEIPTVTITSKCYNPKILTVNLDSFTAGHGCRNTLYWKAIGR
jgi:hypothetical protein